MIAPACSVVVAMPLTVLANLAHTSKVRESDDPHEKAQRVDEQKTDRHKA